MSVRQYRARWGVIVILTTVLGSALLLAIPVLGISLAERHYLTGLGCIILPSLIWLATLIHGVFGYELHDQTLLIKRFGWVTRYSLGTLRSAERNPEAMKRSMRLFGNSGVFAICGWFKSKLLGRYRAYVTNFRDLVVMQFDTHVVVVSPEQPQAFIDQLVESGTIAPSASGAERSPSGWCASFRVSAPITRALDGLQVPESMQPKLLDQVPRMTPRPSMRRAGIARAC